MKRYSKEELDKACLTHDAQNEEPVKAEENEARSGEDDDIDNRMLRRSRLNNNANPGQVLYRAEDKSYVLSHDIDTDEDPIIRNSREDTTREDIKVITRLQEYYSKNKWKNIVRLALALVLIIAGLSGLLIMSVSALTTARVTVVNNNSKDSIWGYRGAADYIYTVNGKQYSGTYNYVEKNQEYVLAEGDGLPVYYLRFMPSFSLEERAAVPGILNVILFIIGSFFLYDGIVGLVENRTIKKYFRERNIVCN